MGRFLTDKGSLLSALQLVQGVVEKKSINPILSSIVIETSSDDQVTIEATNLEESIKIAIWAEVYSNFKVAIPFRRLTEFVRELPDLPITVTSDGNLLNIEVEGIKASFPTMDLEDYPGLPEEPTELVQIGREFLISSIGKVDFSIAKDAVSTALMGMLFKKEGSTISFVSTDGHRLSLVEDSSRGLEVSDFEILLPRKGVTEILKILEKKVEEDVVYFGTSSNHFFMKVGSVKFFTRLLDAKFPNYKRVIPTDFERSFVVNKSDMMKAVKRVSLFSDDKIRTLKIHFLPEEKKLILVSVKPSGDTFIGVASQEIYVENATGTELTFGINGRYLMEALGAFDSEKVRFELGDPLWPIKLSTDGENYIHVVMPVTLEE
ncbi:MAG: DNA polymerase III subunit beta [Thermosulfidibacteraceae bacterium]|jgi:DNA polymerase-3 subunit beta